jgi:hypothetical protein
VKALLSRSIAFAAKLKRVILIHGPTEFASPPGDFGGGGRFWGRFLSSTSKSQIRETGADYEEFKTCVLNIRAENGYVLNYAQVED